MKKSLVIATLLFVGFTGFAQQDYQFTQFFSDRVSLNPGAAGMDDNCLDLFFREQWTNFSGNPQTYLLNYHQPVKLLRGGLGITAYQDKIGNQKQGSLDDEPGAGVDGTAITTTGIRLSYSYHHKLGNGATLGGGISLGYLGANIGTDWYAVDDEVLDPAIPNLVPGGTGGFDLNLGVFYNTPKFWAGLSSTHLTGQELGYNGLSHNFNFGVSRHYYFMSGYNHQMNMIKLMPAIMVKSDGQTANFEGNVRGLYDDFAWVGLSYRSSNDALAPMFGLNFDVKGSSSFSSSIQIGYSYDITLSEIGTFSNGSHEINLGYCWKFVRPIIRKPHGNPRFL